MPSRQLTPRLQDDLALARKFVVYPGQERYRIAPDIEAISLAELATELSAA